MITAHGLKCRGDWIAVHCFFCAAAEQKRAAKAARPEEWQHAAEEPVAGRVEARC